MEKEVLNNPNQSLNPSIAAKESFKKVCEEGKIRYLGERDLSDVKRAKHSSTDKHVAQ